MIVGKPHISVCVCTYKRMQYLKRLLVELAKQNTNDLFTFSVVVSDNDRAGSSEQVVREFTATSNVRVTYCVEPEQNIARARNKAVEKAEGDFIAFIDDDEFPAADWLRNLFETCLHYRAEGVLGPVEPHYECETPDWVRKGGFFERPCYATGHKMNWPETRTGNLLFKKQILDPVEAPFRTQFDTSGEDMDFFRRMMDKGCTFVWSQQALVYESVPSSRCNRAYLLRRALLRGSNFPKHRVGRTRNVIKSLIAVPCYAVALPFLAIFGQHVVFNYTIKLCDHGSRLLALMGWRMMTRRNGLG